MKINVSIEADDSVKDTTGKVLRNYDGRVLEPGEVLVAMDLGEDFIEVNVTNPDSIKIIKVGQSVRKVVFVAVPKEQEAISRSQLYFLQNEDNGKYRSKGEVSADAIKEGYDIETPDPLANVEATVEEKLSRENSAKIFEEAFTDLLATSPKLAYALLLVMQDTKGKEFSEMMKLGHECANNIRKEAERLYEVGLDNIDLSSFKEYKMKNTDYYRKAAEAALDHLLDFLS